MVPLNPPSINKNMSQSSITQTGSVCGFVTPKPQIGSACGFVTTIPRRLFRSFFLNGEPLNDFCFKHGNGTIHCMRDFDCSTFEIHFWDKLVTSFTLTQSTLSSMQIPSNELDVSPFDKLVKEYYSKEVLHADLEIDAGLTQPYLMSIVFSSVQ